MTAPTCFQICVVNCGRDSISFEWPSDLCCKVISLVSRAARSLALWCSGVGDRRRTDGLSSSDAQ